MSTEGQRRYLIAYSTAKEVGQYLPSNYRIIEATDDHCIVAGEDRAGWTLEDYVIPRLGSGWIRSEIMGGIGNGIS